MEAARTGRGSGAFGLEMHDGHTEMIDEPMVKQVRIAQFLKNRSIASTYSLGIST